MWRIATGLEGVQEELWRGSRCLLLQNSDHAVIVNIVMSKQALQSSCMMQDESVGYNYSQADGGPKKQYESWLERKT